MPAAPSTGGTRWEAVGPVPRCSGVAAQLNSLEHGLASPGGSGSERDEAEQRFAAEAAVSLVGAGGAVVGVPTHALAEGRGWEERRVGEECVSTWRSRWS